ncbi:helix-turn-helix protein [Kineothrix alysoides]|uniref:Helix-turn-helix protein n=1 Tax=Kineothrix alysoides TaxID=1469948 RepID=A0A4R1R4D8_9FIRM|nr:GntR family transcriptional regulator YhfZ [Kineothrix alysoides]TCL60122.1 helix-turn-helix protein [Kineothrix alysoides]
MSDLIHKALMQKGGIVAQQLAQEFIGMEIGQRVPTIEDFINKYNVPRGTVQQALLKLKEFGAIELEAKGHLGSFLIDMDYTKLMEICSLENLVGVMPLPYSKRYEGLATGIYTTLNQYNVVSVNLAFMGGSDRRIQALLDGRYDFAVMSLATAKHYVNDGYNIEIVYNLGMHTYVNAHTLIMRKDFNTVPKRIGVDRTSFDQLSMTTKYFKNMSIEIVPLQYSRIIENIKKKNIDAAIWSLEEKIISDDELQYKIINDEEQKGDNTKATIIIKKEDVTVCNFFKRFFDIEKVQQIQNDVLMNVILPNY